jgi:SPP1 gp7 family putative phage head morphogenesis protein
MRDYQEIPPVRESSRSYERIELRIKKVFLDLIYLPLVRELNAPIKKLKNAKSALLEAIQAGRVSVRQGYWTGKFTAAISKELRELGATWDKEMSAFRLPMSMLTPAMREAVRLSESRLTDKFRRIDEYLVKLQPEIIAQSVKVADLFDTALLKVDKDIAHTLRKITIPAQLTPEQRRKIAAEWQDNMELWIKDWSAKEIVNLRKDVQKHIFAGNRYEHMIKTIKTSYGVSENKAKFLARQETNLLMSKFKETRYAAAGVKEYRWQTVVGSPNHPVRPAHKSLNGKIFAFDNPPVTTAPDEPARRNNPGEDYNCRCTAIPLIRFKGHKRGSNDDIR